MSLLAGAEVQALLADAAGRAVRYLADLDERPVALVRRPGDLRRSFAAAAGYLPPDTGFEATNHTPQSSQRARQ